MAVLIEQIGRDRRWVNADWRYVKRATNRARRRAEKIDPESAPKKTAYHGYVA